MSVQYGMRVIWGIKADEPTPPIHGIPEGCTVTVLRGPKSPAIALLHHPEGAISAHIIKSQSGFMIGPWVLCPEYARSDALLTEIADGGVYCDPPKP